MEGYIHSLESFGTVDGPGVRFVTFFQGCPLRCLYCHNPDTWNMKDGKKMTSDAIIERMARNRGFYTTGGLTATGGEPLLQIDFLTELFEKAKLEGFSTCLDTSGIVFDRSNEMLMTKFNALAAVTDLVMLDIKHMQDPEHIKLTGASNVNVFAFAEFLESKQIPVWIRHVVVPGITMDRNELEQLGNYLARLTNLQKLEILRYHTMGRSKYENMCMPYPLEGVPQLRKEEAAEAEQIVLQAMEREKSK
ncbi:MAG: pyruvate formate-lyase-activating protein [Lachnospiraceae bacterium]